MIYISVNQIMKKCEKCFIDVATKEEQCPLCQGLLVGSYHDDESYPYISTVYDKYQKFFKWLLFVFISISFICIIINVTFPTKIFWSGFVISGIVSVLFTLWLLLKIRGNVIKNIFSQMITLFLFAYLWDYFTGWIGWSITYVIPTICIVASINMTILVKVLNLYIEDYFIYCLLIILMGLIPIIFLRLELVIVPYISLICVLVNIILLVFILVFYFENVIEELKRRFHF